MSAEDLAIFLRKKMGEQRSNNIEMVRRTGISRRTWYRLLNADIEEARLSTLVKLTNALGISVTELMDLYFGSRQKPVKKFKADIHSTNLPSNSLIVAGQAFVKAWEVTNTSKSHWRGLTLKCIDSPLDIPLSKRIEQQDLPVSMLKAEVNQIKIPDTFVGEVVKISVLFLAPEVQCTTISHWRFYKDGKMLEGEEFPVLDCLVKVVEH